MSREAMCPNCGGPIEFKMGSAYVLACPWCRSCVMRGGANLETIGKVGDLVPTAPELNVGDTALMLGGEIVIGGRMQLDHGKGPWDEWYVENTQTRQWAWLAKAQGRWYYTVAIDYEGSVPTWQQMAPGQRGALPGVQGEWVVGERGQSKIVSAEGELPYPFKPDVPGGYVDLSNAAGGFATIDYGDGSEKPRLFVGRKLQPGEFKKGERIGMGSAVQEEKLEAKRLRCPTCGDAVPIRAPSSTERVVCESCSSLLDYRSGDLSMLKKLADARTQSPIPLGTEGTLDGEKVLVIGFMERATKVDFTVYRWREFLLHTEGHGFWWLMEDNGHFQLIKPIETGEVEGGQYSRNRKYKGESFPLFSRVNAWVDTIVGEFYWKVERGETAELEDYVAPPRVISAERTDTELVWSVGEHIEGAEVWKGLGLTGKPPHKRGVGVVQPNPYSYKGCLLPLAAAILLILLAAVSSGGGTLVEGPVQVAPISRPSPDESGQYAMMTPVFHVDGPTVLGVTLAGNADNQYVGAACALINENTREVDEFYMDFGKYRGVQGGYTWSEGSTSSTVYHDRVATGDYRLRVDPFYTSYPQPGGPPGIMPPSLNIVVHSNDRSPFCFIFSLILLLLPGAYITFRHIAFENGRNENKNV